MLRQGEIFKNASVFLFQYHTWWNWRYLDTATCTLTDWLLDWLMDWLIKSGHCNLPAQKYLLWSSQTCSIRRTGDTPRNSTGWYALEGLITIMKRKRRRIVTILMSAHCYYIDQPSSIIVTILLLLFLNISKSIRSAVESWRRNKQVCTSWLGGTEQAVPHHVPPRWPCG